MPISAHGAPDAAEPNGFTLVELLVVLTIVGLLSAAVVVALPEGKGAALVDAERFAARAKHAQDVAILDSRPISVRVDAAGYGFERRQGTDWAAAGTESLARTEWSEGVTPVLANGEPVRIGFDPTGAADPWRLMLRDGEGQAVVEVGEDGGIHVAR